jgi:transposase, IS30 family
MKVIENATLRVFVDRGLKEGRSPESIAGRLKHQEKDTGYVSKEGIKTYLKSVYGRQIESLRKKLFPTKRPRNKGRTTGTLDGRTFIEMRPQIATRRQRVGDVEADFILSGKQGQGILLTVADRKIRVSFIEQILIPTIKNMERAFVKIKKRFPEMKTMTTDNDLLFQHHRRLEKILKVKIYFCHPYHSWKEERLSGRTKRYGDIYLKGVIFPSMLLPSLKRLKPLLMPDGCGY